jgi:hypothetical protein
MIPALRRDGAECTGASIALHAAQQRPCHPTDAALTSATLRPSAALFHSPTAATPPRRHLRSAKSP